MNEPMLIVFETEAGRVAVWQHDIENLLEVDSGIYLYMKWSDASRVKHFKLKHSFEEAVNLWAGN